MEEVEESLKRYELQLAQVEQALRENGEENSEDLQLLRQDLADLIQLTKDNLLELKKKELLSLLPAQTDDEVCGSYPPASVDWSCLEGVKCKAPHRTVHSTSYQNAVIFSCQEAEVAAGSGGADDVRVRVVFLQPTQPSMLPCRFFMDGCCRFSDEQCKFSHGELVLLSSLKEYEEPDFGCLAQDSHILAEDPSDRLWHHAIVQQVLGQDVHLRFQHRRDAHITVTMDKTFPLTSPDQEGQVTGTGEHSAGQPEEFVPIEMISKVCGSAGALGQWELHTKGIGSKLMAAMGYVTGTGLGVRGDGRVEPVPAMLYPAGKSLDWCMERKQGQNQTVEKVLKNQAKKAVRQSARPSEEVSSTFLFLNKALQRKATAASSSAAVGSFTLNQQRFRLSEDIRRGEREVSRLKQAHQRLATRDPTAAKSVVAKLQTQEAMLAHMVSREQSLEQQMTKMAEKKKLTIF